MWWTLRSQGLLKFFDVLRRGVPVFLFDIVHWHGRFVLRDAEEAPVPVKRATPRNPRSVLSNATFEDMTRMLSVGKLSERQLPASKKSDDVENMVRVQVLNTLTRGSDKESCFYEFLPLERDCYLHFKHQSKWLCSVNNFDMSTAIGIFCSSNIRWCRRCQVQSFWLQKRRLFLKLMKSTLQRLLL